MYFGKYLWILISHYFFCLTNYQISALYIDDNISKNEK